MFPSRRAALPALLFCAAASAQAAPLLSESFDSVAGLAGAGWVFTNDSSPPGLDWFQGNPGIFTSHEGAPDAYVAASFLSADIGGGSVSNWLITPELSLATEVSLSFWTRTELADGFADALEVRLSTAGASSSLSDFGTVVLAINAGLAEGGYPSDWTQITVNVAGAGAGSSGRLAFHYALPDNVDYGNYIGIDTVNVNAVPEPATYALMALGLAGLGLVRRRRGALAAAVTATALIAAPAMAATVVKDPDTGRLRAPTAAEFKAMKAKEDKARQAKGKAPAAQEVVRADGSASVKLGADTRSYSVMTRNADGSKNLQCVTGEQSAKSLVKADKVSAKTIKTTEEHGHDHH